MKENNHFANDIHSCLKKEYVLYSFFKVLVICVFHVFGYCALLGGELTCFLFVMLR